jgi:Fe-S oxidoreductase
MTLQSFHFDEEFVEEACDFCGLCFHNCPVLKLPIEKAKKEIKSLVESGYSKKVLTKCTSCMACNHYCPNDCHPHTLILTTWNERYLKNGLPKRAKFALPYHFPNLYSINIKNLTDDEKKLVEKWEQNWKDPKGAETVLYTGCNSLIQPFLLDSKIFDNITIFGSPKLCCGEPLYRMGCLDAARTVAEYLKREFDKMGFKKMVVACLAGYHLFKYVFKQKYGIEFDFEIVSIIDWLWEQIETGKIQLTPLNKTATIHDNCWPKASGDHFFDRVRDILKALEVEIIEPKHTRENALCCGIGAAAANYSLTYSFSSVRKRLAELNKTKADLILDYCGGCNWYLNIGRYLSFKRLPIYHLVELIQMSIGEKLKHRPHKTSRKILTSMLGKGIKGYLSFKHFHIDKILDNPVE